MKISTFVTIMLMVSLIFFVFSYMVTEANQQFDGTENYNRVNSSSWNSRYDVVNTTNTAFAPLESKWKEIENPDIGFFTKIVAGISAIPYAIILVPRALFSSIGTASRMVSTMAASLNIPEYIIVHHTGGTDDNPLADTSHHTFEIVDAYHKSLGWDGIGYNWFIEKDGKTVAADSIPS